MKAYINDPDNTIFLMIDIQEKLLPAIDGYEDVSRNAEKLLVIADVLKIPVKVTEQYKKGLGPTVAALNKHLANCVPFEKTHFGCGGEKGFYDYLTSGNRNQIILFGIESHICVHTTAMELLQRGYDVTVVADACSSRNRKNHELALANMLSHGAHVLPLESVAYQLIKKAGTPEFKALLPLFK